MIVYNIIVELIVNVLRVLLLKNVMGLFLLADEANEKKVKIGFGTYYVLTTILYCVFQVSVIYEIGNYIGLLGLTFLYQEVWKKRIWVSLVLFSMDMACSLIVFFAFAVESRSQQPAIQVLLLLICVAIISHISYPAASKEIAFDKRQTLLLAVIPMASVVILCMLLYAKADRSMALVICVCILLINISVFYLYNIILENYIHARENDIYKQQTYAYQNQLDVIMESQNRIRALRHDMKNHMLGLQALLQKEDVKAAEQYLESMQYFMVNPSEYVATGNETIDSLLNYKIQRAKDILSVVNIKINIPEQLDLHSFDLNVVLGNLLDNAMEASSQTEEKMLDITMKLVKGVLFLNICNSCQAGVEGKQKHRETTKEDRVNHGIGLKNVQRIVEKYQGDMDILCDNGRMEVDIMMYIKDM